MHDAYTNKPQLLFHHYLAVTYTYCEHALNASGKYLFLYVQRCSVALAPAFIY